MNQSVPVVPFEEPNLWLEWLWQAEQSVCPHTNFVNEGYGNPDSGGDGGYCPTCGWAFWVTFY